MDSIVLHTTFGFSNDKSADLMVWEAIIQAFFLPNLSFVYYLFGSAQSYL